MRTVSTLFMLMLCTVVQAATPTIVLQPDGTAWYSAGDGTVTIIVTNVITPPGTTPTPPGGGGGDPTPPGTNDAKLRADAKAWAKEADDVVGATFMKEVYGLLSKELAKGTIPADAASVDKAITAASKQTWDMMPGKSVDKWKAIHMDKVMPELAKRVISNGGNLTKAQWVDFFGDVSRGFADAHDGAAIPPFLMPLITALIKVLISLLTGLFA